MDGVEGTSVIISSSMLRNQRENVTLREDHPFNKETVEKREC
jgi:hypothetical protein